MPSGDTCAGGGLNHGPEVRQQEIARADSRYAYQSLD
jgi:hypothetical protein